jgi:dihydrofolate synthase/folylpolyglutamate synthase
LEVSGTRPLTILDGAHNPAGAKALAAYVSQLRRRRRFPRTAFVLGVLKDKDWRRMMRAWAPLADRFFTATPPDPRGLEGALLQGWLKGQGCPAEAAADLSQALGRARRWAGPQGLVVAAGSLYSVGALLRARQASPAS